MAKLRPFTSLDGVTHPESYWRPTQVVIDVANRAAGVTFTGYHDEAARRAKRAPVGTAGYTATGEEFDAYFSPEALDGANPVRQAYLYAQEQIQPETGKSFFDGAADV